MLNRFFVLIWLGLIHSSLDCPCHSISHLSSSEHARNRWRRTNELVLSRPANDDDGRRVFYASIKLIDGNERKTTRWVLFLSNNGIYHSIVQCRYATMHGDSSRRQTSTLRNNATDVLSHGEEETSTMEITEHNGLAIMRFLISSVVLSNGRDKWKLEQMLQHLSLTLSLSLSTNSSETTIPSWSCQQHFIVIRFIWRRNSARCVRVLPKFNSFAYVIPNFDSPLDVEERIQWPAAFVENEARE